MHTRQNMPSTKVEEKTDSGQTRIIFSSYPALQKSKGAEVEEVTPPDLTPTVYQGAVCLGTLTVATKESAGAKTDFAVVQGDAMRFLFDEVKGFRKVALVSLINSVSAASGVSTDASSFGIGGVLGHLVSALTSVGLGPTFSKGSGQTNPTNFPGGTFLVLAVEEAEGQTLDSAQLGKFFLPQQAQNGATTPMKIEAIK